MLNARPDQAEKIGAHSPADTEIRGRGIRVISRIPRHPRIVMKTLIDGCRRAVFRAVTRLEPDVVSFAAALPRGSTLDVGPPRCRGPSM
jgi:hypothetical protein